MDKCFEGSIFRRRNLVKRGARATRPWEQAPGPETMTKVVPGRCFEHFLGPAWGGYTLEPSWRHRGGEPHGGGKNARNSSQGPLLSWFPVAEAAPGRPPGGWEHQPLIVPDRPRSSRMLSNVLGASPPDPPIGKKIHRKKIQRMKTPHTPVTLASSVGGF